MANVRTTFTSDDRDVQQALAKMTREMVKLREENRKLAKQTKETGKESKQSIGGMAIDYGKAALSMTALTGFILKGLEAQKQLRREAERTAIALDTSARKFRIQAGLNALQAEAAQERVAAISQRTGASQQAVNRIATEGVSQGFADPLKSGLVSALIAVIQGTGEDVDSADLEGMVGGVAKQLTSEGKALTGRNAASLVVRMKGLADTALQPKDLPDYSKAAKKATGVGVDEETFLSAAAILSGSFEAAQGATGLRNTMTLMNAPSPTGLKGIEALGLTKEDIDLVGETLPEALNRLKSRLDQMPAEQRGTVMRNIFGQESSTAAMALMQGAQKGEFERFALMQREGSDKVAPGVNVQRGGLAAGLAKGEAALAEEQRRLVASGRITQTEVEQQRQIEEARRMQGQDRPWYEDVADFALRPIGGMDGPVAYGIRDFQQWMLSFTPTPALAVDREEILRRRESQFRAEDILGPENRDEAKQLLKEIRDGIKEGNEQQRRNAPGPVGLNGHVE